MGSVLLDPVTGWLAGRLGDAWWNLLRGSPDERLVRRSMANAVEAVIDRVDLDSRDALRRGLALCFTQPPPDELGADPMGGLRAAVAAQVGLLRSMQASDGSGRMFFDSVKVDERWLAGALAEAFEAALRQAVAARGPIELVRALDTERTWSSLGELRALLLELSRRSGPPPVDPPGRCLVGVIPAGADCYQDRAVAARLEAAAGARGAVVLCQVLAGMGGVGKTQLAAAYARHARDTGQVTVLVWATAATPQQIVDAYARAALRLIPGTDPADPQAAAQRFMEWMAETSQPWLVVLDDVQRPGDVVSWWPPDRPTGQVVVTTRHRSAAWRERGRLQIDVGLFTPAEARAYLRAKLAGHDRAQTDGHADADIDALTNDLGRLPLALAQAAAFIINEDLTLAGYRRLLAERLLRHAVPEDADLPDEQRQIVAAIWDLSVDQADRARPAGMARPLLYLASVLDPNGIPAVVLTSPPARDYLATCLPETIGNDQPGQPGQSTTVTEDAVVEALRVLHRFNLIDHDRYATHQEVRIHQLIQRATRENQTFATDGDLFAALADAAADALLDVWPQIEHDQLGAILRANTTALHATTGTALWTRGNETHPVLYRSATSLGETGQVTAAITEYTHLNTAATQNLGPDHPDTLATRANLAHWRGEAGDPAGAAAVLEELLPDTLRVLGLDHPHTLSTRGELARWRGGSGDPAGAATAYQELLTDYLRVLGPDHPHTLATRTNLAVWRGAAGDPAGAAAVLEELVPDTLRALGPDHPETLIARSNLAVWRGAAGDPAGAATAYQELLTDCLRLLGPDHPNTLTSRNNLAHFRGQAGDPAGAAAAFQELLTDCLRLLGPDHPHTLSTRGKLARWRGEAGDPAGAAAVLEELVPDTLRALGPDHPETLTIRGYLAYFHGAAGDPAGAAAAFQELLTDYLRLLGPDHPETLIARSNLAVWRGAAGDPAGAAAVLGELLTDDLRVLGPDHPETLATRSNLAVWRGAAGDPAGAAAVLEELLTDCLRVLGPDHPNTLATRNSLAHWQANKPRDADMDSAGP